MRPQTLKTMLPADWSAHTAVVRFVELCGEWQAIVLRRDCDMDVRRLASSELRAALDAWQAFLTTLSVESLAQTATAKARHQQCLPLLSRLGDFLWPSDVDDLLGSATSVVVLPDRPLWNVPFHALHSRERGFVFDRFTGGVGMAFGQQLWRVCRERARAITSQGVLGLPRGRLMERPETLSPDRSAPNVFLINRDSQGDAHPLDGPKLLSEWLPPNHEAPRLIAWLENGSARWNGDDNTRLPFAAIQRGSASFIGLLWDIPSAARRFFASRLMTHLENAMPMSRAVRESLSDTIQQPETEDSLPLSSPLIWGAIQLWGSDA
ncbi:MAG: CHAT domain-containing protein [Planctomycetaceae bacterium]